jgi:hypothetical protein
MRALHLDFLFCKTCILAIPLFRAVLLLSMRSLCSCTAWGQQQSEDLELIHRSQAGNTEAFGALVTKYRAKIYTMLYGMVRNENDAWDLAQEGFLQGFRQTNPPSRGSAFLMHCRDDRKRSSKRWEAA